MTTEDMELVRDYARHGSEEAFATLVSRHVHLVYSVALRQLGDVHLAEEVTQSAFIILARKAGSLNSKTILPAWLCRTAHYAAAEALRNQRRRQRREQEIYMQSLSNQQEPESSFWSSIAPLLDSALQGLREKDRTVIVLRFFEGRDLKQVGTALGVSENAATKRVNHALEKLRLYFSKRGVNSTAGNIARAISANSVQTAPIGLAKAITLAAVSKSAAASTSTLSLAKEILKIMAYKKSTIVAASILAALLLGGTAVVVGVIPGQKGGILGKQQQAQELRQQMHAAKTLGLTSILSFAQAHDNELPKSMAELQSSLPPGSGMDDDHWELVASGKITPEFLQQKDVVLLRQKNVPRGQPKIVGYADGHFDLTK